jgi:hypothetical protein
MLDNPASDTAALRADFDQGLMYSDTITSSGSCRYRQYTIKERAGIRVSGEAEKKIFVILVGVTLLGQDACWLCLP